MREILFRGKRTDNGQWAEGFLVKRPSAVQIGDCSPWYISVPPKDPEDSGGLWNVTAETVGQFTGLTDKNGKKIFEGDIVHILGNQDVEDWKNVDYIALIAFLDGGFCAIDGTIEEHAFRRYALERMDFDMEVIGNIHDNPELIEVE